MTFALLARGQIITSREEFGEVMEAAVYLGMAARRRYKAVPHVMVPVLGPGCEIFRVDKDGICRQRIAGWYQEAPE